MDLVEDLAMEVPNPDREAIVLAGAGFIPGSTQAPPAGPDLNFAIGGAS
ncbi:MAG: hypothetical protein ABI920_02600 [Casimicrobiaceae bacterium]